MKEKTLKLGELFCGPGGFGQGANLSKIIHNEVKYTFASVDAARYFFNAGGTLRWNGSMNGFTSDPKTLDWENLFEHVTNSGSPYPVITDDTKSSCFSNASGNLEGRIKSYFENDWEPELEFPMMILPLL